jgi:alanine racemase
MAVVKAFAYGHGDIEVARTAIDCGCEYLGVAFVEEGIKLRDAGIENPILVFGAQLTDYIQSALDYNLELTLTSKEQLDYLNDIKNHSSAKIRVHLKVDTGMNRIGFPYNELEDILSGLKIAEHVDLCGVYSHFATSDEDDSNFYLTQIHRFKNIHEIIKNMFNRDILFHIANSAAIMKYPESYFDLVRPGIMLYGQPPSSAFKLEWDLKEALSLRSRLGLIKYVKKNEPISYGRRFYTKESTYIGVIPAGYADGLNRQLTNRGRVLIGGEFYPLVGTVCMDMIMVNLGSELHCKTGDEVIFYGEDGDRRISISEVAEKLNTIPYEVTCNVSARVPRKHIYS